MKFKVEILRRFTPQNDGVCHSVRSEESDLYCARLRMVAFVDGAIIIERYFTVTL